MAAEVQERSPPQYVRDVAAPKRPDPLAEWKGPLRGPSPPRALQLFSPEYLKRCEALSAQDVVRFLDEFRRNYAAAQAARAGGG